MPEQPGPTLRDMIKAAVESGLTYEQLEKRATDAQTGEKASGSFLNRIVKGDVPRMPYDYHLRAIAAGLAVPYERVRLAAIRQWLPAEETVSTSAEQDRASRAMEELREIRARYLDEIGNIDRVLGGPDAEATG